MIEHLDAFIYATVDACPALILATVGAVLSERSGVVSVGVDGMMRAGAFAAAVAALAIPTPWALCAGMAAAALLAAVHAYLCLRWSADQVVSGMALNLVTLATVTFVLESTFSPSGTPSIPQLTRYHVPWVAQVPILRGLSGHSLLTYVALASPALLHLSFARTAAGLRLRAVGERPAAAAAAGISVGWTKARAVLVGGALAGLGGAALSTSTLDRFEHHMPAGLGFMALAAMVFGRWSPWGAAFAAIFFSAASALRVGLGSSAPRLAELVPRGFLLALPYALTLLVLSAARRHHGAPAGLGKLG